MPGRTRGIGDAGQREKVCSGDPSRAMTGVWRSLGGGQNWGGGEEAEELRGPGEGWVITWMSGSPD